MSDPIFFRLLFFRPPQVHREETTQLSQTLCKLQDSRCVVWTLSLSPWLWLLDTIMGIYAVLTMFYASLFNNQDRNDVVMFWKLLWDNYGNVLFEQVFYEIKVCLFSASYIYVFIYVLCFICDFYLQTSTKVKAFRLWVTLMEGGVFHLVKA